MNSIDWQRDVATGTTWAADPAFDRIRRTHTFRGARFDRWCRALIGIIGAGVLGARIAMEAVRSGARVWICDFDVGSRENLGTQCVRAGIRKVDSVVAECDAIRPGRTEGVAENIRAVGIGVLNRLAVILDCTDDPSLAWPLTRISNGLGRPLLRCAVDGSGRQEFGRVLCSHGGRERHACQVCTYGINDLLGRYRRTPCPGAPAGGSAPTLAGGPIGMVIAGAALLQAQRLVTGNDRRLVLDRELLIDLGNLQIIPILHRRSAACLSGHVRFRLEPLGMHAAQATLADVFAAARQRLHSAEVTIEAMGHPLSTHASCDCGAAREAVGSVWGAAPACLCGQAMTWRREVTIERISAETAAHFEILRTPLLDLALPDRGAVFVARADGKQPVYLVLD